MLEQVRDRPYFCMQLDENTDAGEALPLFVFGLAVKRNTICGVDTGWGKAFSFFLSVSHSHTGRYSLDNE